MNDDQNKMPGQAQASPQKGNAPIDTLWDGSLKVAIFRNQREHGVSYSAEPGRIYTDAQGNIQEAKSFSQGELLRVSKLSDKAYDRISEFRQQMKTQPQERSQGKDRER